MSNGCESLQTGKDIAAGTIALDHFPPTPLGRSNFRASCFGMVFFYVLPDAVLWTDGRSRNNLPYSNFCMAGLSFAFCGITNHSFCLYKLQGSIDQSPAM